MLLQQTIDPAPAAELARQVEKFLQGGGQIDVLPGPAFTPAPARKHPQQKAQKRRPPRVPAHIMRYREFGPQVIRLAEEGLSTPEISRRIRKSSTFVLSCLDYFGVDAPAPAKPGKTKTKVDEGLLEQIKAMAADRYSLRYAAQCLDMPPGRLKYIADQNQIAFGRNQA